MKTKYLLFSFFVIAASFQYAAAQSKQVDVTKSTILWEGKKVGGSHDGTISLSSGNVTYAGGRIMGGAFVIDMKTITCTDIKDPASNASLVGHLKSDDFFGVEKHPEARFVITRVSYSDANSGLITGNLTIKGITRPIEFPFTKTENVYTAKIPIDRSQFDVRFGSGSFFDNLGNNLIYDIFTLDVSLVIK